MWWRQSKVGSSVWTMRTADILSRPKNSRGGKAKLSFTLRIGGDDRHHPKMLILGVNSLIPARAGLNGVVLVFVQEAGDLPFQ